MRGQRDQSFFDDKHAVMEHGSAEPGVRQCCYAEQAAIIESLIPEGTVVVDVGCGPTLPYHRSKPWFLIGVDMSYESLRANTDVDLPVYASAGELPLADRSVDAIVSLYAIHHFGGQNRRENQLRVARGFSEFRRVLKPGGGLFVFELSPWWPVWQLQRTTWNLVRKVMPGMDIFFWREGPLLDVAAAQLGHQVTLRRVRFKAPPLTPIPPVFACPALKIPRLLFPFHVHLYHWTV
jgi:SAM-dependent methyltransferase